ncbi:MAG: YHS domain-containing protein [Zestosphaera sp.]
MVGVFEVDPVCGMRVDPVRVVYKAVYGGRVFYFCSKRCRDLFLRDPEYYLEHGPEGMFSGFGEGED